MIDFKLNFDAIGTRWVLDCFDSDLKKEEIEILLMSRIEEFDRTYSRFRKDSLIWEISEKKGEYIFPEDAADLFDSYKKLSNITNGLITPLIGNSLVEAGYDSGYSLIPGKLNKVPDVDSVYEWNSPKLKIKKPYVLDFGALGKGYLIDIVSDLLRKNGVNSFCVNAGGDIRCENLQESLRIGLENPINDKQVLGVIELNNKSICASSGNRRKWDEYNHIINPKTLKSSSKVLASWVVSDDTITADGLATALFLVPPKKLIKYYKFEYFILYPDFKFKKSKGFSAELFLKEG